MDPKSSPNQPQTFGQSNFPPDPFDKVSPINPSLNPSSGVETVFNNPPPKQGSKLPSVLIGLILLLALAAGVYYFFIMPKQEPKKPAPATSPTSIPETAPTLKSFPSSPSATPLPTAPIPEDGRG